MGIWGPGLYENDIGEDIREYYLDQLRRGRIGREITEELIKDYKYVIKDVDEAPLFWFALADTQWELGRLEPEVEKKAIYYISIFLENTKLKNEAPIFSEKRRLILSELLKKLSSVPPDEKKIKPYHIYRCKWKIGDVYAYPLESDYADKSGLKGRYFLFYKIGERSFHPGHIIPVVWVKITNNDILPRTIDEINEIPYVQTGAVRYADRFRMLNAEHVRMEQLTGKPSISYPSHKDGFMKIYVLSLINTSKRIIPKNLVYIGNYQGIFSPKDEFVPENEVSIPGFLWKYFDKCMIDRFFQYTSFEKSNPISNS